MSFDPQDRLFGIPGWSPCSLLHPFADFSAYFGGLVTVCSEKRVVVLPILSAFRREEGLLS